MRASNPASLNPAATALPIPDVAPVTTASGFVVPTVVVNPSLDDPYFLQAEYWRAHFITHRSMPPSGPGLPDLPAFCKAS